MSVFLSARRCGLVLLVLSLGTAALAAQDAASPPPAKAAKLPTIAEEPKTIDPTAFLPKSLAASATVRFADASLREVLEWLRKERNILVLVDAGALDDAGVTLSEPISDRLDGQPVYLLLNRLRSLNLAWYPEDDAVHVTSIEAAESHHTTVPYNVGDLLDAGYDEDVLLNTITHTIHPDRWDEMGGAGSVSLLGDVMLVRQTDDLQREVQGLLAALRKHGRRTFALDPSQHLVLRQKLEENVSVAFADTPLETAVAQLAKDMGIDIRLDLPALRETHIRPREPVTLKLTDRKLRTVLQAMLANLKLTWMLRDGVLWITSPENAEELFKRAVYDVRDLCRDHAEATALEEAIVSGTGGDRWEDLGGGGVCEFPQPGIMVLSGQERLLTDVLDLLETYRAALRASKPRVKKGPDPKEVLTVYYRLHENVAIGLVSLLPNLVQPESWQDPARPDAPGQITLASSPPDLFTPEGQLAQAASKNAAKGPAVVVARAVMIIRQTRAAHEEIAEVIRRVSSGDARPGGAVMGGMGMGGMGGMGGGMGGFGSGYLVNPPANAPPSP